MIERANAVLVLEDGTTFHGKAVGKIGKASGELAFNTGMTGYQEVFTDPSYLGQLVIMTSPHIGNYGTTPSDSESENIQCAGIIVKKFSEVSSRDISDMSLQEYLIKDDKVGISDIDTRALVRYIRSKGAMNAIISSDDNVTIEDLQEELKSVPSMKGLELASQVSTKKAYVMSSSTGKSHYKVALIDFGTKTSIARCLNERDCEVKIFPMNSSLEDLLAYQPDGFVLSNGPGDPAVMTSSHELVKDIINTNIPVFGICMGHQIIALSQGLVTEKMHQGHRGLNHPVLNHKTGKGEITSQNHGFVVSRISAEDNDNVIITHSHLNDNTVAGIALKDKLVFSVQYHPESSAGPHDSRYLFDEFISNMDTHKQS
ncbi:MAG TPA: glutamine-hydrolyzing carbamoyl-phosphate synthase small subunit [Brumimicrobium sp.]|nr:glutamine-hydrolyzing carbamoyl-phosphate synthase small subunit [Brumimicrobium sp.]